MSLDKQVSFIHGLLVATLAIALVWSIDYVYKVNRIETLEKRVDNLEQTR